MAVRLEAQMKGALQIAHWLRQQPEVVQVLHPGLPGAPRHELWRRDFSGACSLFGVEFKPSFTPAATHPFVEALDLFGIGASWVGMRAWRCRRPDLLRALLGGAGSPGQ
jgi:cystathionine beta-lyase